MKQKIFSATADTLKDSELRPLYDLWESRRGERFLPDRKDFQFREFQPWFGRIAVGSIPASGQEICFDLVGTEITNWDGLDMTGRFFPFPPAPPTSNWSLPLFSTPIKHKNQHCLSHSKARHRQN
ncbi:PAS domain-containing protein [Iodidimonas gelatinilytica]|uniref:PAS domain-containing protein n=1 Tax=Iodidimonas gelatinilytica TaxID=1236966 RepID=UPI001230BAA3|nr:PAS domain-containing protein [Iodidimonas gelatinilytica]